MVKVIAKKVSMLELFYDLVFVYAIAKITAMIHHPHHGGITLVNYLQFTLVVIVIMQVWLYQTLYTNRFATDRAIDRWGILVTMFAMIYLANNINTEWSENFSAFQTALLVILGNLICQYSLGGSHNNKRDVESLSFIGVLTLEFVLVAVGLFLGYTAGLYLVAVGYLCGFLLPLGIYRSFSVENVNFPHLVERLSLITIITFGETVVNITSYFKGGLLAPTTVLIFILLLSLFGVYRIQVEDLIEEKRLTKGFVLMYSHVLLVLSLLSLTVGMLFINDLNVSRDFLFSFASLSLLGFYSGTFANSIYNKSKYQLTKKELWPMVGCFVLGICLMYWQKESQLGFLALMTLLCVSEYGLIVWRKQSPQ